jgi:hypothetical protein
MSQGNVGRVWLKFFDIGTQQNTYSWWSVNCFSQTCRQENHEIEYSLQQQTHELLYLQTFWHKSQSLA